MKRLFTLLCICAVLLALAACAGLGTAPEPAAPGSGEAAAADGETVSAASGLSGDGAEPGAVPALEQEAESGLRPCSRCRTT